MYSGLGFNENVFELWLKGGKVLPFKVRRCSWSVYSAFIVRRVVFSRANLDYFEKTGELYGRAFGDSIGKYPECNVELSCAGRFEWARVDE